MTQRWNDYFSTHGAFESTWLRAAVAHWGFNEVLYGTVLNRLPPPARILDVGSGPGWSDLLFSSLGYEVTGIDNEPKLVDLANDLAARMQLPTRFEFADASDLAAYHGRFDLAYSCGVLEHFDRDATVNLLREQALCAKYVLIQIPTRFSSYAVPMTDERIYTVAELRRIVEDAGLDVVHAFGYGDVTVTRTQIWMRRVLPRMLWRALQDEGYAFAIAVLGRRRAESPVAGSATTRTG
jgi:SAM-dependent methyltransferase